jgi:CubicO group peptidase (beta-lactamase class C family)
VSKHVATIGLMQLYEQGKFTLDDDISTALGFQLRHPLYPNIPITYRMILSHQSSLGESLQYDNFITTTYNMMSTPFPEVKELL